MFVPRLSLRSTGGALTLIARVDAPNGCYSNSGYEVAWPKGMTGIPETKPVQLRIKHSGALICTQAIVSLEYAVPLGDTGGYTSVAAFTMEGDQVRGRSSIELAQTASEGGEVRRTLASTDANAKAGSGTDQRYSLGQVYAWVDRMPPGPPSFHATAQVQANSSGWTFSLEPASPQGINPNYLILDLRASEPKGQVLWVMSDYTARYDQDSYDGTYTHVTVRDGDDSVSTRVQEVF